MWPEHYSVWSAVASAEVYAGSKFCLSLDMCTALAKPCEYMQQRQMSL